MQRRDYWGRSALHAENAPPAMAAEIVAETRPPGLLKRLLKRSSAASESSSVPHSGLEISLPQQVNRKTSEEEQQQQEVRPRHSQEWMQRHMQVVAFLGKAGLVSAAGVGLFTLLRWVVLSVGIYPCSFRLITYIPFQQRQHHLDDR